MSDAERTVSEEALAHLLRAAELSVPSDRHGMIAEQLAGLFDDASELNEKMAQCRGDHSGRPVPPSGEGDGGGSPE